MTRAPKPKAKPKPKPVRRWAGYIDERIDWNFSYGSAALFRSRQEARQSYEDVRRVRVTAEEE